MASNTPPEVVLVPFKTKKLAQASVIFHNFDLLPGDDEPLLDRFAYLVPSSNINNNLLINEKVFYAERYGGEGMRENGGGVRCGLDSDFHVKGIGFNLLVSQYADKEKFDGYLLLRDAVCEAALGEVCHRALPYGGARAVAVLSSGFNVDIDGKKKPAGLVVRESVVRAGHFIRSIYFKVHPKYKEQLSLDAERVRAAISLLPDFLPKPYSIADSEWHKMDRIDRLHIGLSELAMRHAKQTAAAEAKRIVHGAISASNISLDGRWIDFETMSILPGYGNVQSLATYFWDMPGDYTDIFEDLCYYVSKYFQIKTQYSLPKFEEVYAQYWRVYRFEQYREFFLLAGFPVPFVEPHWNSPILFRFSKIIIELAQIKKTKVYRLFPEENDKFGEYRIGTILTILAALNHSQECELRIKSIVSDESICSCLVSVYRDVVHLLYKDLHKSGVNPEYLRRLTALNAAKAGKTIKSLLKRYMYTDIFPENCNDNKELRILVENKLKEISDQADFIYQKHSSLRTCLWKSGAIRIEYDATDNMWHVIDGTHYYTYPWNIVISDECSYSPISEMRNYWGGDLWRML
jgi:hypothetical protein